jgi:hypothetical protein
MTMDLFHLDLGVAIAMAAIKSSIPHRSIITIIILATLIGRRMVWALGVSASPWSTCRCLVLGFHLYCGHQGGIPCIPLNEFNHLDVVPCPQGLAPLFCLLNSGFLYFLRRPAIQSKKLITRPLSANHVSDKCLKSGMPHTTHIGPHTPRTSSLVTANN